MKTKSLTLKFVSIALLFATTIFNSCKKEDKLEFPYDDITLLIEDGAVFTSLDDLENTKFFSGDAWVFVTESPEYNAKSGGRTVDRYRVDGEFKPYTKYYWYLETEKSYIKSEIRSFYYIPTLKVDIHNVEGDWAAVVKWEKNDYLLSVPTITLKPDKDCKYDNTPISVPSGQDSCYISAGDLGNQKYQIYHNWWDEANGKYYEPVIYDFELNMLYLIGDDTVSVSTAKKGIFLNTDGYVADKEFNVYRYGKIGNRTWMLDDLRAKIEDTTLYHTVKLESGLEIVLYADSILYPWYEYVRRNMIPKGFHLATDEDWFDLEAHFGIEEKDGEKHWRNYQVYGGEAANRYIADGDGVNKNIYESDYFDYHSIYDWYSGKESKIRDYLIADNEWKDINDATKKLKGSHIFNAHPAGIPYKTDNVNIKNPYIGYGVIFYPDRILWSGCDGICRLHIYSKEKKEGEEASIIYRLFRCVKDE